MINEIKPNFDEPIDTVIAIGDSEQANLHMKEEPKKGKGMRKALCHAGFMVGLVEVYCSSCKCRNRHCKAENCYTVNRKTP